MGITNLEVTIQNPANPKLSKTEKFLVDSGAAYSVVPTKILKKIGIIPTGKRSFILANGEKVGWDVTLESLGLILDPIRRELKPLPMLLM